MYIKILLFNNDVELVKRVRLEDWDDFELKWKVNIKILVVFIVIDIIKNNLIEWLLVFIF